MRKRLFTKLLALSIALTLALGIGITASAAVLYTEADQAWYDNAEVGVGATESNPYIIKNISELEYLASLVNSGSDDFNGKYVKLSPSFENVNGSGIATSLTTPIGRLETKGFCGSFDGNNKEVSLSINLTIGDTQPQAIGMFGYTYKYLDSTYYPETASIIKNVATKGTVFATAPEGTQIYLGGVVGKSYYNVTNCSSSCAVSSEAGVTSYVGGVVGFVSRHPITGCSFSGTVTGGHYTGGIAANSSSNCIFESNSVTGQVLSLSGSQYTGGVVGFLAANCTLVNCCASGSITSNAANTGGLFGFCGGPITMTNCYTTCDISVTNTGAANVGGLCGQNSGPSAITNCYSAAKVSCVDGTGHNVGTLFGINYGGLLTNVYSLIHDEDGTENDINVGLSIKAAGVDNTSSLNYPTLDCAQMKAAKGTKDGEGWTAVTVSGGQNHSSDVEKLCLTDALNDYAVTNTNLYRWCVDSTKNQGYPVFDFVAEITASDNGDLIGMKYSTIAAALTASVGNASSETDATNPVPTVITLIADNQENVNIPIGRNITLDLNGYVLGGDDTASVITNSGMLTIKDRNGSNHTYYFTYNKCEHGVKLLYPCDECSVGGHAIGYAVSEVSAVFSQYSTEKPKGTDGEDYRTVIGGLITGGVGYGGINNMGTLTLLGGTIIDNKAAQSGGGVTNDSSASFEMNGGAIIGNVATMSGSGICNCGSFYMKKGIIEDNVAFTFMGGVDNYGTFKMDGGSIRNNLATLCAGGVGNQGSSMIIGGNAEISGNIANGKNDNLLAFEPVTIGTGENGVAVPSWTNPIGVSLIDTSNYPIITNKTGAFTDNGTETDTKYFSSDCDDYYVKFVTNHFELAKATVKIDKNIENGKIEVDNQEAATGTNVTITSYPDKGYKLDKITVKDKDGKDITHIVLRGMTVTVPANNPITVSATFTYVGTDKKATKVVIYQNDKEESTEENPETGASFVSVVSGLFILSLAGAVISYKKKK